MSRTCRRMQAGCRHIARSLTAVPWHHRLVPIPATWHRRSAHVAGALVREGLVGQVTVQSAAPEELFPFVNAFAAGDTTLSAAQVIDMLATFMKERRIDRIRQVCAERTFDVVPVIEGAPLSLEHSCAAAHLHTFLPPPDSIAAATRLTPDSCHKPDTKPNSARAVITMSHAVLLSHNCMKRVTQPFHALSLCLSVEQHPDQIPRQYAGTYDMGNVGAVARSCDGAHRPASPPLQCVFPE